MIKHSYILSTLECICALALRSVPSSHLPCSAVSGKCVFDGSKRPVESVQVHLIKKSLVRVHRLKTKIGPCVTMLFIFDFTVTMFKLG